MSIDLTAPITAVTVYTNRARVTRAASIDLEEGETTLVLSGLPDVIDADSVRVSGKGAGITIRGVDVKPDVQAETSDESKKALEDQLETLGDQQKALEHEQKNLDSQLEYFKYVHNHSATRFGRELAKNQVSVEQVTVVAQYIRDQTETLYTQQRDLKKRLNEVNDQITAIAIRLASNNNQERVKPGQSVHIAVDAERDMTFSVEIEYLVTNAFWKPLYDVRLRDNNTVELTYLANVTQKTDEDWNDVELTLSTAKTAMQRKLPKLRAWYVHDVQHYIQKQRMNRALKQVGGNDMPDFDSLSPEEMMNWMESLAKRQGATDGLTTSADMDIAIPNPNDPRLAGKGDYIPYGMTEEKWQEHLAREQQVNIQQASVNSGAVSVSYTVGTPVSILGNGEPHKTTIVITGLQAELDYLTAPRIAAEAYLRATITNTSDYTILPGEASVFHENDFVGKTQVATIAPNDEFKVQLGVDDRIKVERELVKRDTGTRRIGTAAKTNFEYTIDITNLLPKNAKVTVQDQFPVSKSSKINIKLDNVSPKPQDETDLHILTWELELEPQQEKTISLAFTVEHGRNQTVYGLDD